jgi:hypothetical protein
MQECAENLVGISSVQPSVTPRSSLPANILQQSQRHQTMHNEENQEIKHKNANLVQVFMQKQKHIQQVFRTVHE